MLRRNAVIRGFSDKTTEGEKTGVTRRGPVNVVEEPEAAVSPAVPSDAHQPSAAGADTVEDTPVDSDEETLGKRKAKLQVRAVGESSEARKKQKVVLEAPAVTAGVSSPDIEPTEVAEPKIVKIGGKDVVLKENEVWPGVLSAGRGLRPLIAGLTAPEGPAGVVTLDVRTHKGWLGEGPKPADSIRAFTLPNDMAALSQMSVKEHSSRTVDVMGQLNTYVLGLSSKLCTADHELRSLRSKHKEALLHIRSKELIVQDAERVLKEAGQIKKAADEKLMEAQRERDSVGEEAIKLQGQVDGLRARVTELEEGKKEAEERAKELEESYKALQMGTEGLLLSTRQQAAKLQTALDGRDAIIKVVSEEAAKGKLSYVEQVKRFLRTKCFFDFFNKRAGPAFQQGFDSMAQLIGPGRMYDPEKHTMAACVKMIEAEEPELDVAFAEDMEAELPVEDLEAWCEPENAMVVLDPDHERLLKQ